MAVNDTALINWVEVIRGEYCESPGLSLTRSQVQRLWGLDPVLCDEVLRVLVSVRFLRRTTTERYVRVESET